MPHHRPTAALVLAALLASATPALLPADSTDPTNPPGLGDPGPLASITVDTGRTVDGRCTISGRDASQQLLVVGHYASGQLRDLTRDVTYEVVPADVVQVDSTGHVVPIAEGTATIHIASSPGIDTSIQFQVTNIQQDVPVNFPNQIVPIFTKHGCNGGGCHGKSGGQNGFQLSLLGFEPTEDYEYLVKEARGRRVFPSAPERSLLLLKATAKSPHGGGQRVHEDSPSYRLMRRWIEQGLPYGNDTDPVVTRIEMHPAERIMDRESKQQLAVVAHYSNGSTEDVTRMTQFESNDTEMAEATETGLISTGRLTGSVAVMARYQGHVSVFRATVPLGVDVGQLPATVNFVDERVFEKLTALGLPASPVCDDQTFLRRATIDIAGRLPTLEEAVQFLENTSPTKRNEKIDELLDSADYADLFANKWSAILRNKRHTDVDKAATFAFHDWIRHSLYNNKPYDQFVREILTATGEVVKNPTVQWFREVSDQSAQVEDTAQLFLGQRIQCARCHHHPFEKWSQRDYYAFSAFFAQLGKKPGYITGMDRLIVRRTVAQAENPKTSLNVPAQGLGSPQPAELTPDDDARHAMVDWMTDPSNPFFAKALVNRYWKHFFSRGLVDPEDDMRVTNPSTNPALLEALADDFVKHDFDLKHLIRRICSSHVYQLSANPNQWNQDDKQNFSRYYPKRLNAEVLLDAINQVTGTATRFGGVPTGTRAVQLPDNGFSSYFLTVFGRPEASSACECERSGEANLAQSLHLLNSSEIQTKLTSAQGNANRLAQDRSRQDLQKLRELYLLAYARLPDDEEISVAKAHLRKHQDNPQIAFEDIVWALVNTKEFMFNH